MASLIAFVLGNFTLTLFVIGLAFTAVALARAPKPLTGPVVLEKFFFWFLFFSIGVSYLYNAVFHIFFGKLAASYIGWADSPFQLEVGFASLGFGLIGLLAPWRSFDMRLAAILGPSAFLLGRRRRPHLPDDHRAQFRAGQCRHHLLERHHPPDHRPRVPVAAVAVCEGREAS